MEGVLEWKCYIVLPKVLHLATFSWQQLLLNSCWLAAGLWFESTECRDEKKNKWIIIYK